MQSRDSLDFISGLEAAAPMYSSEQLPEVPFEKDTLQKTGVRDLANNDRYLEAKFEERFTVFMDNDKTYKNMTREHIIQTEKKVPKLGVMFVGLGGNNGSTFVASILANKQKMTWATRQGDVEANFYGSLTQSATAHVGFRWDERKGILEDVYKPIKDLLPMVNPVEMEISGWDISGLDLY